MRSSVSLRLSLASFFSDTAEYNLLLPTAPRLTADESELTRATLLCMFRKMSSAMEERRGEERGKGCDFSSECRVVTPQPLHRLFPPSSRLH